MANLLILLAAIFISIAVFAWLIKVVKATFQFALIIAVTLLIAQLAFGIGPAQVMQQISRLWQYLWNLLT